MKLLVISDWLRQAGVARSFGKYISRINEPVAELVCQSALKIDPMSASKRAPRYLKIVFLSHPSTHLIWGLRKNQLSKLYTGKGQCWTLKRS